MIDKKDTPKNDEVAKKNQISRPSDDKNLTKVTPKPSDGDVKTYGEPSESAVKFTADLDK